LQGCAVARAGHSAQRIRLSSVPSPTR
jgi:hypothetical protein